MEYISSSQMLVEDMASPRERTQSRQLGILKDTDADPMYGDDLDLNLDDDDDDMLACDDFDFDGRIGRVSILNTVYKKGKKRPSNVVEFTEEQLEENADGAGDVDDGNDEDPPPDGAPDLLLKR